MAWALRPAIDDSTDPGRRGTASQRKALLGLGLGNLLEWYDWMLFGLLSSYIGPLFFPSGSSVASTMSALAVFGVGFAVRPLGGVLLGTVADRFGRRRVMLLSVALMSLTTLVMAIAPTHAVAGPAAGLILLVCRLLQGVSTGIEAPLSTAYAVELVPPGREARAAGTISLHVNLGIGLASVFSFVTSLTLGSQAMHAWGWRLPFAAGAVLGLVVLHLRRSLPEVLPAPAADGAALSTGAVWRDIARHWPGLLAMLFVVGAAQAYNYAWSVGLPNAAATHGESSTAVFAATSALSAVLIAGSPLTGRLADRVGLGRTFIVTRLLAVPGVFLMLLYQARGMGGFTAVLLGGSVVLVLNMTLYNVVATSLMPQHCRATGVALGYGVAVALFGGTAPYLMLWLQEHGARWLFPVFASVLSLLSVVLYVVARRTSGTHAGE
ncbi:MFS transporter [Streptomyces sp. NBC_00820]|uniref:MFS transporter n=1 Tax=Streptomyces sp. NBC_00820 TaxID=2975842 RepID=UPI002ED478D9|nr:MFS transporter [Streptomyces sp. NBC_00820]